MPETISAAPQNDYTLLPSPQGAKKQQFAQIVQGDNIAHLVSNTSTYELTNQPLNKRNTHLCNTKSPDSWSSELLQGVLRAYYKEKPEHREKDLTNRPKLKEFLSQDESKLTQQQYATLFKEIKKAGHGRSSQLPTKLQAAWRLTQAQQLPSCAAPLPETFIQLLNIYLRGTVRGVNSEHVKKIKEDIAEDKTIGKYLKLEDGKVKWKCNEVTDDNLESLSEAFKKRHKGRLHQLLSGFSVENSGYQMLYAADKAAEPQRGNKALQTARDSVPPAQDAAQQYDRIQSAVTDLKIAHNNAPDTVPVPSPEGLNSVPRTGDGPNRSAEPYLVDKNPVPDTDYPEDKNPFPDTDYPEDKNPFPDTDYPEDKNPVPGTNNAPNTSAELNSNKNKAVADAKANSVEQTQPSNVSATLPQATSSANTLSAQNKNEHYTDDKNPFAEDDDVSHTSSTSPQAEPSADLLPNIVLQSLNKYLTTLNGRSFGDVNKAHVKKIKEDIANNEIISQYLRLNNNKLEWRDKEVVFTKDVLNSLLNAFKAEHKEGESMYKVLSPAFKMLNAVDKATEPQKGDEALQAARDDESKAVSVEQAQTSNSSTTSSAATLFLQLLNKYIKTKDRQWGESINEAHVKKMHRDITKNSTIGELLILKDKQLQWTRNNVTDGDLHSLLNEFRKLHNGGRSSLLQVLSDSELPALGFQMLDAETLKNIIQKAAEPALHMPGSGEVVKMKRDAITKALEFFSAPKNHEKPLPTGVLDQLIEHYGRTKKDLDELQKSLKEIKSEQTLNDDGFLDALKRSLGFFKPEERLERFSKDVAALDTTLRTNMLSWLDKVQTEHPPESVSTRTNNMLIKCQKEAHDLYAEEITGTNIFSDKINPATIQQIVKQAQKNSHTVLKEIIAGYGKKFIDNLTKATSVFSVSNYLRRGTSRKEAADDIIAINKKLDSLYGVAQTHHEENIRQVTKKLSDSDIIREIHRDFESLEQGLAYSIQAKVLDNCKDVLSLYDKDVEKIKVALAGNFSKEETNSKALRTLSNELTETITKIRSTSYKNCPTLEKENLAPKLDEVIKEVTQPLLQKIKNRLPKLESIGTTLISAFKRAFEPTPAKILGCIPLIGGLTLALTTLPKLIAIPLGITAAVVLPFALLGWVGWNIYNCFNQRSNIKQTLKTLETINFSTAK